MSENKLKTENATEVAPKKCCSKIKAFFTNEAKEGQRVVNWKFWVLAVVVVALVWVIL